MSDLVQVPRKLLMDAINFISICKSPVSVGESAMMMLKLKEILEKQPPSENPNEEGTSNAYLRSCVKDGG